MEDDNAEKIAGQIAAFTALEGKRVLEIGCGNGRITSFLAGNPGQLIAIDPVKEQIEEARSSAMNDRVTRGARNPEPSSRARRSSRGYWLPTRSQSLMIPAMGSGRRSTRNRFSTP